MTALTGCTGGDHGDEPSRSERASACADKRERITADIDGDGHDDVIWRGYLGGDPITGELVVGVCTRNIATTVPVGGMGEGVFRAIDINRDGRSEIVSGGTTVSQTVSEILVFVNGRLISVPDLYVADGPAQFADLEGQSLPSLQEQWGCEDFDGNGSRKLVVVSTTREREGATAHVEAYRIVGATARQLGTREHALDHMPDFNERLVASC